PNISLLPLDEVPVHVHRFAARAPCDSKGSECQCGIHRAETASALRGRKTERAAKEKPTPISQIFFSTCCALYPPPAGWVHPRLHRRFDIPGDPRSEEHTSELQSRGHLVCRLLLAKKKR